MQIQGSIVVSLSLTETRGTRLSVGSKSDTREAVAEDRLDIPEIVIQTISDVRDLDRITRPIIDVLYQCYGQLIATFMTPAVSGVPRADFKIFD